MPLEPVVPEYITVHLGAPDQPAQNVTVPFIDYIKNVASSELYPTWPEEALRANIYAQISYALNRIYTEWYRSRGYDFDITNSTQYDQSFVYERDVFANISQIVDELFNDYVTRQGFIQPLFTQYCDGVNVTCPGLSQWGTVDLANQGYTPYQILQHFYGEDINIIANAPVGPNVPSYPGVPLHLGDAGEEVRMIQRELNRIAQDYPSIPIIPLEDGIFNLETEAAVKAFQRIFDLTQDGIVGKSTWYKILYLYINVKRLADLYSEGLTYSEIERIYPRAISEGDVGDFVRIAQYFLSVIGTFDYNLPAPEVDGDFGPKTKEAVIAFQTKYGLTPDGIIGRETWYTMRRVYDETLQLLTPEYVNSALLYPGYIVFEGQTGQDVRDLQTFLAAISDVDPSVPKVTVDGIFGPVTAAAVREIQRQEGLPITGSVGTLTWYVIAQRYLALGNR